MLVLTRSDVRRVIQMEPIIDAVAAAHAALARGTARLSADPPVASGAALILPMAAAIDDLDVAGVKLLTDVPGGPGARSVQRSTITVVDPASGTCVAFLDGVEITRYRTAAASAVATRHLAGAGVRTLGLLGAGAQARTHLRAMLAVRDFERVVIWNRTRANAEAFAADQAGYGIPIEVLDTAEAVVSRADVLCTLTPSCDPFVRGEWLRPGMHINAVGAPPRPDHREIDTVGISRSLVVVDDLAAATSRSGEICLPLAEGAIDRGHIHAELGQLVLGTRPGRTDASQITLFNSVGLAIQDLAAAQQVIAAARAQGIGTDIELADADAPVLTTS